MFFKSRIDKATHLEIKDSPLHGRGVFATSPIRKGALIETAPAVFLSYEEKELLKHSPLFNYYFLINNASHPAVFGFGNSSFYNHSAQANCFYTFSVKQNTIRFYAYRKILKGQEVTINYNGQPDDNKQVYFPEDE